MAYVITWRTTANADLPGRLVTVCAKPEKCPKAEEKVRGHLCLVMSCVVDALNDGRTVV